VQAQRQSGAAGGARERHVGNHRTLLRLSAARRLVRGSPSSVSSSRWCLVEAIRRSTGVVRCTVRNNARAKSTGARV